MPLFFFSWAYLWSGAATLIHFWLKYANGPTLDVVKSRRSLLSTKKHLDFSGRFKDDPSILHILQAIDWCVGRAPSYPVLCVNSAVSNTPFTALFLIFIQASLSLCVYVAMASCFFCTELYSPLVGASSK